MSDVKDSEELSLIADSVRTAAASLRFMRIAFDPSSREEMLASRTLVDIADAYFASP